MLNKRIFIFSLGLLAASLAMPGCGKDPFGDRAHERGDAEEALRNRKASIEAEEKAKENSDKNQKAPLSQLNVDPLLGCSGNEMALVSEEIRRSVDGKSYGTRVVISFKSQLSGYPFEELIQKQKSLDSKQIKVSPFDKGAKTAWEAQVKVVSYLITENQKGSKIGQLQTLFSESFNAKPLSAGAISISEDFLLWKDSTGKFSIRKGALRNAHLDWKNPALNISEDVLFAASVEEQATEYTPMYLSSANPIFKDFCAQFPNSKKLFSVSGAYDLEGNNE